LYIQAKNNGWLTKNIIEKVAETLSMSFIRVMEVASFYSMFNLEPVGKNFIQICRTTPCWLRGSDKLLEVAKNVTGCDLGETSKDDNDVWALGVGGRVKLSKRISLNLEYYYIISQETAKNYDNSLTLGFDIETGGHVFQLFFSNSRGITEQQFIPETTGNWLNGDIHFGFNISRTFVLKKPKEFREKN